MLKVLKKDIGLRKHLSVLLSIQGLFLFQLKNSLYQLHISYRWLHPL